MSKPSGQARHRDYSHRRQEGIQRFQCLEDLIAADGSVPKGLFLLGLPKYAFGSIRHSRVVLREILWRRERARVHLRLNRNENFSAILLGKPL